MLDFKYIIILNEIGNEIPIIFPNTIVHKVLAKGVREENIISAGFCNRVSGEWGCYGESETLKLKSRLYIDERLLNKFYSFQGD